MKKLLLLLAVVFLIVLSIPLSIWWMTLDTEANVSYQHNSLNPEDLSRINQFIQQNEQAPTHKRIDLSEQELNQLIHYGSQKFNSHLDFAGHIDLHEERSQLLISLNTHLPLRPYLNLQIDFATQGKSIQLLGGKFGSMDLPQHSVELLVNMTMPYAQQHPQYQTGTQLWQTIEAITIKEDRLTIDFIINQQLQTQIQQRHLETVFGKNALARLPFYQQAIEQSFESRLGQRIKLHEVMKHLFTIAVDQNALGANPVDDNKAIILALFLHTVKPQHVAALQLDQHIQLPSNPIELTIERRADLARHFLSTAAITLFADSTVADTIGLFKELQDQNGFSGFSASDLIADRAGSLFASQLTFTDQAASLQKIIAATPNEQAFFPATNPMAQQLEQQLLSTTGNQQALLQHIEQQIDQHARSVAIYQ